MQTDIVPSFSILSYAFPTFSTPISTQDSTREALTTIQVTHPLIALSRGLRDNMWGYGWYMDDIWLIYGWYMPLNQYLWLNEKSAETFILPGSQGIIIMDLDNPQYIG